jgi:gliding motility-associated-like protein
MALWRSSVKITNGFVYLHPMHKRWGVFLFFAFILLAGKMHAQHFVENQGQWPEPFSYKVEMQHAAVFVSSTGFRINLTDPELMHQMHDEHGRHKMPDQPIKHHGLEVLFNGASPAKFQPQGKQTAYHNYFLGKDASRWKGNVPLYETLLLQDVYPKIDLILKPGSGNLKYDVLVKPGGNPANIVWTYNGADYLKLKEGRLIIGTSLGEVVEEAPVAWQIINGQTVLVDVQFVLTENNVGYKLGKYNPQHELVIDPNYIFSSYTGSTADNFGYTATFDSQGHTYGGGIVFGAGYPLVGAFQSTPGGGMFDTSISKFSPNGTALIFSTYLGGTGNEQPHSMIVDSLGNLIVLGVTGSANYPFTANAYDTTFNGGPSSTVGWAQFTNGVDIFVTKFSPAGNTLVGSTFLGGTSTDGNNQQLQVNYGDASRGEVMIDATGNIYYASVTGSTNFPTVGSGIPQATIGGAMDAVVGKFNPALTNLLWSTYLGGTAADAAYSLKLNPGFTQLFVAGGTKSDNFPVSANAYQTTRGGNTDGFIVSLNATTGALISGTYNGTAELDQNYFVDVDFDGDVYVFGQTKGDYPVTPGLWGITDGTQFIHKFSPNLQQSKRSITFGSGGQAIGSRKVNISPTALMVDGCKSVYISGWGGATNSPEGNTNGLPVTPNAFDTITDGSDLYFLVLDGSWQFIEYATFFGGQSSGGMPSQEHVDGGTSRFSPEGIIYQAVCAGCGSNSLFPAFPANVVSTTNNSANCNMACLRIDFELREAVVDIAVNPDSVCAPYTLAFTDNSKNVDVMTWNFGDGTTYFGRTPNKVFSTPGTYQLTIIGVDTLCNTSDTTQLTLFVFQSLAQAGFTADYDTCGFPFTVQFNNQSTNAKIFRWNFGDGTTSTLANPVKAFGSAGTYNVFLAVRDSFCNTWDTAYATVFFKEPGGPISFDLLYDACVNASTVRLVPFASGYHIYNWQLGNGSTSNQQVLEYSFANPGTYTITLTTIDTICNITTSVSQQVTIVAYGQIEELVPNVFTPNQDNVNDTWQILNTIDATTFTQFKVEVYNRWGQLVFETTDPKFTWLGDYTGNDLADGVYFWLAWYTDICGRESELKGAVHIMR